MKYDETTSVHTEGRISDAAGRRAGVQSQTYRHPYPPHVAKAPSDSHTARMSSASTQVSFAACLTARIVFPLSFFEYLYSSSTFSVNGFNLLGVHVGDVGQG